MFLAELGVAVALGVLLDTMIVRSVLVTAINLDLGGKIWWPSKLDTGDAPLPEPGAGAGAGEGARTLTIRLTGRLSQIGPARCLHGASPGRFVVLR